VDNPGGVWVKLSDEQMLALDFDERWYRVYPEYEPPPGPGMVLIPHSQYTISAAGGTATKKGQGQVEFTGVPSLSLDGVFSADFDNYVISLSGHWLGAGGVPLNVKLRSGGTDTTGSDYTYQTLVASSTSVSAARTSGSASMKLSSWVNSLRSGHTISVYGPALAQPTAYRTVSMDNDSDARINENAGTHSLSTAYDGFTIEMYSGATGSTGTVAVYGVRS